MKASSIAAAAVPVLCVLPAAQAADAPPQGADPAATGFVIFCATLVLLMSAPAIGLFYGGLARAKNIMSVLQQCLAIFCLALVLWFVAGYSLAFGSRDTALGQFFGSWEKVMLLGVSSDSLAGGLPEFAFIAFQGAFCAISACLIVGATVERIRFSALLVAVAIWIVLSYAPQAHMVWGGGFIDAQFHAYDFAGGVVVHINAAVAGLVGAMMLGPRRDLGRISMAPHNLPLTFIGAGLLWIGWCGFNAGSELAPDATAALALFNTLLAPAAAALAWMCAEWVICGKPSGLGTASGVIAGLVAITPACAFVGPLGALVIGLLAGVLCLWGVRGFKRLIRVDDSLDVFGIHGLAGIAGGLLTGIFCAPSLGGAGYSGDWTSMGGQFLAQLLSIAIGAAWSAVVAYAAFRIAGWLTGGLRVNAEDETEGLDLTAHGESGYNL